MRFNENLMEKAATSAERISQNRYLVSIIDWFILAFTATMFASIAIIIQNIPSTFGFQKYIPSGVMDFLNNFFGPIGNATMNISALFIVFGVAYFLAKSYEQSELYAGAIAVSSFLLLTPFSSGDSGSFISVSMLGAQGMFVGLLTDILSTEIFVRL